MSEDHESESRAVFVCAYCGAKLTADEMAATVVTGDAFARILDKPILGVCERCRSVEEPR